MASQAEMFQFVASFGPMLGELAARLEFAEMRIERLEGGANQVGGAHAPAAEEVPDEAFEFMGQKFDMKAMLEGAVPAGGMPGLMERLKNWKKPETATSAAAPSTPSAAAPATDTPKTT